MLKRFDNYDELYSSFRWSIPENYNIASDTIDKFSNSERIALKHVLADGNCNEFTFKYLQQISNQLANVLDHLSFKNDDIIWENISRITDDGEDDLWFMIDNI